MKPGPAAVPVEDAEVILEGEELSVPPALVEEGEAGAGLQDEERRQAIGG
jgi:hypothetical protein